MPRPRPGPLMCGVVVLVVVGAILVAAWRATTAGTQQERTPVAVSTMGGPAVALETSVVLSTPAATAAQPVVSARALVDASERAIAPGMTLGVAVLDVSTGELVEGRHGNRPFMSASLSKLVLVVDMLDRRRTEGRAIAEPDLELIGRALSSSDDGAMNVLWGRYDGQGAVSRVAAKLELSATSAPRDSTQWGDTLVTAGDLARIYRHILRDMAPDDRNVIADALIFTRPTATDGFDQFFGLLGQGASQQVYAKQAWVPYRPSGFLLHSAGVVHDSRTGNDYAIALLSIQSYVSRQAACDRLSAVAAAALRAMGASA